MLHLCVHVCAGGEGRGEEEREGKGEGREGEREGKGRGEEEKGQEGRSTASVCVLRGRDVKTSHYLGPRPDITPSTLSCVILEEIHICNG